MYFEEDDENRLEDLGSAVELLSRKWHPRILYLLCEEGELGFNDIKQKTGEISGKVLTDSLKDLAERDVIEKNLISENPRRVKYSIKEKGKEIKPILDDLIDWNEKYDGERKVLVVDDEEKLADIYSKWLDSRFNVSKATNGKEALEKVESENFDLVVLDRMMPDMKGRELLEKIKAGLNNVRAIMVTAKEPEIEIAEFEIDEYLTKPVDEEELLNKASEALSVLESQQGTELESLKSRKALLNQKFSEEDLEDTEAYKKLLSRIEELEKQGE
jgi:DNA-binding HxlR family transcriptional regulator